MSDETAAPSSDQAGLAPSPAPESNQAAAKEPKPSVRESVAAALEQVDRSEAALEGKAPEDREAIQALRGEVPTQPGPEHEPDSKAPIPAAKRAPDGKFAGDKPKAVPDQPKPTMVSDEAPARLAAEAKAAWKDAPEPLRREVKRAFAEMESGIAKHREEASHMEGLDDLKAAAKNMGLTPNAAIKQLFTAQTILERDLVGGLAHIAQIHGHSLQDIAAHVLGSEPNRALSAAERMLRERDSRIQALESEVSQFRRQTAQSETQQITSRIDAFRQANPHMDKLAPVMGRLIDAGVAFDLEDAYQYAASLAGLNTAPAPQQAPDTTRDYTAQTRRGSASISGAPGTGSNPGAPRPASTVREAAERAMRQTGLL